MGYIVNATVWFVGDIDGLMRFLAALMFIDYLTGLMKGYLAHKLSSRIGFKGIAGKICILLLVGIANVVDNELLGHTDLLRDCVIFFYLANEGLSIMENVIAIGLPVPRSLRERFEAFRNEDNRGA